MPERSTINQSVQIGVETTAGTAVAANRRLGGLGFSIGPQADISNMRPIGQKYSSLQVLGKEWSEADLEGMPIYTELPYIFSSLLNTATVTAVMDGATSTGASRWVFESASFGDDAPKTFTVEQGSSTRAHRVSNGIITDFNIDWSRESIELGGTMLAKALEDGITMTASPTSLAQIPVKPGDLSVYLDTTSAGLGVTKLTRALSGSWSLGSRYSPLWVVDRAQNSFVSTVEGEPELEASITQMADAQGMAGLTRMRNGTTAFMRLEAQGPQIYAGSGGTPIPVHHKLIIDMAGMISDVGDLDDQDGVFGIEWTYGGVHDPTWGKALRVEVITTTAAL